MSGPPEAEVAGPPSDPRYVRVWREYLVRLAATIATWLAFPALVLGGAGAAVLLGWVVVAAVAGHWLASLRCPRCGQPFFMGGHSNLLARSCLHCGLPKWSRAPPPPPPPEALTWSGRPPDVQAEVRFLSAVHGGRSGPVRSGYRAPLRCDDRDREALWAFPRSEEVSPGDTATAQLWLVEPEGDEDEDALPPGKSFQIREGGRVVALGVVTKVLGR